MVKWLTFISIASLGLVLALVGSSALSSDATKPALLGDTAVERHHGALAAGQAEAVQLRAGATASRATWTSTSPRRTTPAPSS